MTLESELQDLNPDLRNRIQDLIENSPYRVGITSSWRSYDEQKRLYDGWVARKPGYNPANPPGRSKHEKVDANGNPASEACDLKYYSVNGRRWVHNNAAEYGLKFPIAKENWHAESNGRPYRKKDDMTDEEKKLLKETHTMLKKLTAPRRPDKKDIDPDNLSLADVYTLIEKHNAK